MAFYSSALNIVRGDTVIGDVFVRDRTTRTTERVSVDSSGAQANSQSVNSSISGDGRFVAFDSEASNLVAGDTNGYADVFVHERQADATQSSDCRRR